MLKEVCLVLRICSPCVKTISVLIEARSWMVSATPNKEDFLGMKL